MELDSCTKEIQSEFFIFTDEDNVPHNIIVVDAPGLDDTNGEDNLHYYKILNKILKIGFVHSFFFVKKVRNSKFYQSEQKFFEFFCDALGKSLTEENCALILTDFDEKQRKRIRNNEKKKLKNRTISEEMNKKEDEKQNTEEIEIQLSNLKDEVFFDLFMKDHIEKMHAKVNTFPEAKGYLIDSLSSNSKEVKNEILRNVVLKERIEYKNFRIKKTPEMMRRSKKKALKLNEKIKDIKHEIEMIEVNTNDLSFVMSLIELENEERKKKVEISENVKELERINSTDYEKVDTSSFVQENGFKFFVNKKREIRVKIPKEKQNMVFDLFIFDHPKYCNMKIIEGGYGKKKCVVQLSLNGWLNYGKIQGELTGLIEKKKYFRKEIKDLRKRNQKIQEELKGIAKKKEELQKVIKKSHRINCKRRDELLIRQRTYEREIRIEEDTRCDLEYFKENSEIKYKNEEELFET